LAEDPASGLSGRMERGG